MDNQQQHPITPPPELVQLWFEQHYAYNKGLNELLIEAARWGADQELEAGCEWLDYNHPSVSVGHLRAARRPQPPSLKEQALARCNDYIDPDGIIRRALEALDD
jgi:hypothetical protein